MDDKGLAALWITLLAIGVIAYVAAHWKQIIGREIERRRQSERQSQRYAQLYDEAWRSRSRDLVGQRPQGNGDHSGTRKGSRGPTVHNHR